MKKKKNHLFKFGILLSLILIISTIYFTYCLTLLTGIETLLRTIGMIFIIIISIILIIFILRSSKKRKKAQFIVLIIISLLYSSILVFASFNINKAYSTISSISSDYTIYSTSIVAFNKDEAETLEDIGNNKIGILDDESSIDGYEIPQEIIKEKKLKNKLEKYESYNDLLKAFYNEEIKYVFLPTNYGILFQSIEGYEKIEQDTKILFTKEKKVKKKNISTNTKITKPFTLLLMGVDSEVENIAGSSFNGDSLMLITFNPNTLSSTILSIPRDTYVPISCFAGKKKNKITHAAWYGEECMIDTIEDFTGINIDYYVKINFKGVVNLVDSLGGVEVDVPYNLCEQNSNREFGDKMVYVEEGLHTLNGEEVLALARNRHPNPQYCSAKWTNYNSNDFIRGQNQQKIVQALLNKLKEIKSINTIYKLLDTIGKSMETNMSTAEILSFYNIGKDILSKSKGTDVSELIGMQRLYISGQDAYIYDTNSGLNLYNFIPYQGSIDDVIKAMKINLELEEKEVIKKFSFSVNEPYVETVIGKGNYTTLSTDVKSQSLISLIGYTKEQASSYASKNNIKITFVEQETTNTSYKNNQVINQSYPSGTPIDSIKSLTLTLAKVKEVKQEQKTEEKVDCTLEKFKNDSSCKLPDFTDDTISIAEKWFSSRGYDVVVEKGTNCTSSSSVITGQNVSSGSSIYNLINGVIKMTCKEEVQEDTTKQETNDTTTEEETKNSEE
ncbi:MAG: LCP family protein [Bacilli bacterium]|nr:LCP family protein [Bacilli bacterium]